MMPVATAPCLCFEPAMAELKPSSDKTILLTVMCMPI